jgi:spermidine synthase
MLPIFPFVKPYGYMSHSFHEIYSFILGSKAHDPAEIGVASVMEKGNFGLRYYSEELHNGMFCLPSYIREAYERFKQPITDEDVVFYPDKD